MAKTIPMWPCRPEWPYDSPYLYDGKFYYDKKGGKPCKTMKEAYRERYKVLIHNNAMPPSPSYSSNIGTAIAIAFIAFVIISALVLVLKSGLLG